MTTNTPLRLLACAAMAGAFATAVMAAPKTGGTVYSTRYDLILRTDKKITASTAAKAGFAEALKVTEISGSWLNVAGKSGSGWVFSGYVREDKPDREKTESIGALDASSTTAANAVRPISDEAKGYAERHGLVDAGKDVDWVEDEAHKVTAPIVDSYMKENKKGEYQE